MQCYLCDPVLYKIYKGTHTICGRRFEIVRVPISPVQILPADRKYFTYMGSLTTPRCTEDVLWIVMKQPVQASADQLNLFTRLYPMNARPTQASSGRTIKESN